MNKQLLPAFLLNFVNVLGFSIVMPVLPFIVESYGADEWVYGLLLTLYSAFQFIGAPYLGTLSDERGRRPILLISQLGTLLSWLIFLAALYLPDIRFFGVAVALVIIGFARALDGITGGNSSVANAYVSDLTSPEQKKFIFGYLGGITGIGMILGPGIGGFAASTSLGFAGTILAAIGISLLTLVTIFWMKESHPPEKRSKGRHQKVWESLLFLRRIRKIQPKPIIKLLFTAKLFFSIMMAFYISTIALFLIDLFEFNEKELGYFMLVVGIFLAFNQAFVSPFFTKRFGSYRTLLLGLLLSTIGLFCITLTDNFWLYISFYYIMNLGLSLSFPTFNSMISTHANPEKLGEVMGVSESINSFSMAAFPIIGAALYSELGAYVYYITAALPGIAFVLVFRKMKELGSN